MEELQRLEQQQTRDCDDGTIKIPVTTLTEPSNKRVKNLPEGCRVAATIYSPKMEKLSPEANATFILESLDPIINTRSSIKVHHPFQFVSCGSKLNDVESEYSNMETVENSKTRQRTARNVYNNKNIQKGLILFTKKTDTDQNKNRHVIYYDSKLI